jgi:hypothetical protein
MRPALDQLLLHTHLLLAIVIVDVVGAVTAITTDHTGIELALALISCFHFLARV